MKVNDRGTMKWTSLMLPEHTKMLEELWKEQEHKERPVLDEQQMAENNLLLQEALQNDLKIKVTYFKDHDFKVARGYLLNVDVLNRLIYMDDQTLNFNDIIYVDIL